MTSKELAHKPVLINEIIKLTGPKDNETYFDATFGNGGYSKEFLELTNCNIIAIDRDPFANQIAKEFKKKYGKRFDFFHSKFSKINEVMEKTEEKENTLAVDSKNSETKINYRYLSAAVVLGILLIYWIFFK